MEKKSIRIELDEEVKLNLSGYARRTGTNLKKLLEDTIKASYTKLKKKGEL